MILVAYGTRPEYIKIKPLLVKMDLLGVKYKTVFTGQHSNIVGNDGDPPDASIEIVDGSNRLDSIVQSVIARPDIFDGADQVLVQGDTTSAFAVAMTAYHRKIPIIHLEAGLRTYDFNNPYPEEFNRVAIDHISDTLFCPSKENVENLKREGVTSRVFACGNSGLDNLFEMRTRYGNKVLCTMHRRENLARMADWYKTISQLSMLYYNLHFIVVLHPNPEVMANKHHLTGITDVRDPMSHDELIKILCACRYVITDSGGIQEEASFFHKKTFVCRRITERNECVGPSPEYSAILCESPEYLFSNFHAKNGKYKISGDCPFGDGQSSFRIATTIKEIYG